MPIKSFIQMLLLLYTTAAGMLFVSTPVKNELTIDVSQFGIGTSDAEEEKPEPVELWDAVSSCGSDTSGSRGIRTCKLCE